MKEVCIMNKNLVMKYKNAVGVSLILLGLFIVVGSASSLELNTVTIMEGIGLLISGLVVIASGLVIYNM